MRLAPAVFLAPLMLSWGAATFPATPEEDYFDGRLLSEATREVSGMSPDQLEAFIDYVAICEAADELPDGQDALQCKVAMKKIQIKNSQAPALLRVVTSLAAVSHLVAHGGAAREKLWGYIERRGDIFKSFHSSAAARYAELPQRAQPRP